MEAGTPEGAHGRRQPEEEVMTELQSPQRRSFTAKAIFGLLLAVVMVAAFATAGSARTPSQRRRTSRDEGVLSVLRSLRWVLHDHRVEPERDRRRYEGHLRHSSRFQNGMTLDSDLVLDGPGNNDAYGHVVLDLSTGLGLLTFTGGTGRFSGFHAAVGQRHAPPPPCAWDGSYSFTPPGHDK